MANFCENLLEVSMLKGSPEERAAFEKVRERFAQSFSLTQILPPPNEVDVGDWCLSHWGVKQDIEDDPDLSELTVHPPGQHENNFSDYPVLRSSFYTAWNPPQAAIQALSKQHPELVFTLYYLQEGANLAGFDHYERGELVGGILENEDLADARVFSWWHEDRLGALDEDGDSEEYEEEE